jgi:hypothetical protein
VRGASTGSKYACGALYAAPPISRDRWDIKADPRTRAGWTEK